MNDSELVIAWLKVIAVVGLLVVMIYGLNRIYCRLKAKGQGFGPNSLKAIGIVMFLPILVMLAVLTQLNTEILATLLGTVAGYVLSSSGDEAKVAEKDQRRENGASN